MASHAGLSKKHSPLQKAHYQAYRLEGRATKNLIKRLKTRVRRNVALSARNSRRQLANAKSFRAGNPKATRVYDIRPDLGAIKALKGLGIKGYDSHLI